MTDLSLAQLVRLEWRHGSSRTAIDMTLGGLGALVASHAILSLVPERVITFMRLGFLLDDFGSVLLLNDLLAVYLLTFLVGITGALSVVIVAREEHGLELFLAKPVPAADLVTARSVPVLARMLGTGVGISLGCGLVTALHPGDARDAVSAGGALGGGLALTALALVLVALLMIAFVRLREPFHALLLACFVWLSTTTPAAVLLYRPDAFDGKPVLREAIVLATLVWNEATLAWLAWVLPAGGRSARARARPHLGPRAGANGRSRVNHGWDRAPWWRSKTPKAEPPWSSAFACGARNAAQRARRCCSMGRANASGTSSRPPAIKLATGP